MQEGIFDYFWLISVQQNTKVRSDDTETLSSDREHNKNRKLLCERAPSLWNFSIFLWNNHELAQNLDLDLDLERQSSCLEISMEERI